jgi:uncharacterized protein DUF262/uncharacterized protein DUF1524
MKAADTTLQGILNSPNQYVIPVFQRYYSWGKENWENLWDDISELFDPDQPTQTHFMGSLVFVPEKSYPDKVPAFQVIDGQQRMITMSVLLCALRNVAHARKHEALEQEITQTFLVHPFKRGREHFRVYPRQRDRDQYIDAINHTDGAQGQIGAALDYFTKQIEQMDGTDSEEGLRRLFSALQSRLEFVHITLEGENPYQIFRSLNSTGVDLSEGDLIRNFMFMNVPFSEQDTFDDELWKPLEARFMEADDKINTVLLSSFFRDYLMQRGQYVPPATTFQVFEKRYQGTAGFDPHTIGRQLMHTANLYDMMRGVRAYPDPKVNAALVKLRQLDSSTAYPLLLNLMRGVEDGQLNQDELARSIELVSGFILRRFICGEQSRSYGRWFVATCANLGDTPIQGLRAFLIGKGFPDDARFKSYFVRANLYGSRYARAVLEDLEYEIPDKERAIHANATIEHIMPQTLTETWRAELGPDAERVYAEWLNTIGNLTLSAYNSELQNNSFVSKRKQYAESNINITRQLADYATWTEPDIMNRGQRLAELAATVWIGPDA